MLLCYVDSFLRLCGVDAWPLSKVVWVCEGNDPPKVHATIDAAVLNAKSRGPFLSLCPIRSSSLLVLTAGSFFCSGDIRSFLLQGY